MRRYSRSELLDLALFAKNRHARKLRRAIRRRLTRGSRARIAKEQQYIRAPEVLSYRDNLLETLDFFYSLKIAIRNSFSNNGDKKKAYASPEIDLSTIREISMPAMVVLAAEFDRWRMLGGQRLRPRKMGQWSAEVRQLLFEMGMFRLLKLDEGKLNGVTDEIGPSVTDKIRVLPLMSGDRLKPGEIDGLLARLFLMLEILDVPKYLSEAVKEATINALEHGYLEIEGQDFEFQPVQNYFWFCACLDNSMNLLRVFVLDQGHGIPRTLPQKTDIIYAPVKRLLNILGEGNNDAALIEAGVEIGLTRTGEDGRGRGLGQVIDAVHNSPGTSVRIMSGRGEVKFGPGLALEKRSYPSHIGGTMIEWSIPYDHLFKEQT